MDFHGTRIIKHSKDALHLKLYNDSAMYSSSRQQIHRILARVKTNHANQSQNTCGSLSRLQLYKDSTNKGLKGGFGIGPPFVAARTEKKRPILLDAVSKQFALCIFLSFFLS